MRRGRLSYRVAACWKVKEGRIMTPPTASRLIPALAALMLYAAQGLPLAAQPAPQAQTQPQPAQPPKENAATLPADSVTQHTATIADEQIAYTATAGSLPVTAAKGETAKVFYVAYNRKDAAKNRPVTFVFNGGPGAASAFLHLGALGPRVINFNEHGSAAQTPVRLADNPDSWLGFTDLVFVDPVGTGFSRATKEGEDAERPFFGVEKDADAMADFARLYLTRTNRALSPVFLSGESYGGFRAVLLARRLLAAGIQVKGAVLISPALEFALLRGDEYTLLPLALALPSIAASNTELRDGIDASLDGLGEVESFARTGYLLDLAAGVRTDDAIIELLERYTGLERDTIARNHGRVSVSLFVREYRRRKDQSLSRYDGSVSIALPRPSDHEHFDPILDRAVTALTPAMAHYVSQELGFRTDLEYKLLNRDVSGKWDYGTTPSRQGYADVLGELQQVRTHNPAIKILITHGYTDLVTPYGVSQFLIDQLRPIEGAEPVMLKVYRGGHMMYMRAPSRRQLHDDVRDLYHSIAEPADD
jgi:carboxypeptidase C (cathepsin A)